MRSKVIPRKVKVELKWKEELNNKGWALRLAWWVSTEKEASRLLGLRGSSQYLDQRCSRIRAPCAAETEGESGPNSQVVSIKRAADGRRQRSREVIDEKKERCRANNGSCGTPPWTRKERLL